MPGIRFLDLAQWGYALIHKRMQLAGVVPLDVRFEGTDKAATLTGTEDAPFVLDHNQTFICDPDGDGDQTATFLATAATSTGAASPATDMDNASAGTSTGGTDPETHMSASGDTKIGVAIDGEASAEATADWTDCTTGLLVAAALQIAIRALGGAAATATVVYDTDHYLVTSGTTGTPSTVVIIDAVATNCADDLKLGVANGGTEVAGTASTDTKLGIAIDGEASAECTADWTAAKTANAVAAAMQVAIRALGGAAATVTVAYSVDHYVVTSGTKGTGSAAVIIDAVANNCADDLKLGVPNAGTEVAGTGDAVNIALTTVAEAVAKIDALTGFDCVAVGSKVKITSDSTGRLSSLVIGNGTAVVALGFTNEQSDVGDEGLDIGGPMADTNYIVLATLEGTSPGDTVEISAKTVDGFDVYCQTAASVAWVNLVVIGKPLNPV